jgi:ArsR family transcriptional regulator
MKKHSEEKKNHLGGHGMVCTRCFNILGVESRMKIFAFLREHGSSMVSDIVNYVGLTQPTVSYHLKEMKDVGLLESKRKGKEVWYTLSESCPFKHEECFLNRVKFAGRYYA